MVAGLIISRVAHYYKILTGSVLNNDQSFYCSYIQFSLIYSLNLYQFHLNIQGIGACVGGIYRGDIIDQEAYIGHLQKIRWWPHCGLTADRSGPLSIHSKGRGGGVEGINQNPYRHLLIN